MENTPELQRYLANLMDEMSNFQLIAQNLKPSPGDIPTLEGTDIYGETIPLNGVIGGDHIIYLDFNERFDLGARIENAEERGKRRILENLKWLRKRAGILLADVAGHRITDHLLAAMLHQAFLLGVRYEVDRHGEVSTDLFEHINLRFHRSSGVSKYLTMIYGEIWQNGNFRFISAGHPPPIVFSNEFDRIVEISKDRLTSFPPIGTMPPREDIDERAERTPSALGYKENYITNEILLMGEGDILLLYTDGLTDHGGEEKPYFRDRLEDALRYMKCLSAKEIFNNLKEELLAWSKPVDDVSMIVIKKSI